MVKFVVTPSTLIALSGKFAAAASRCRTNPSFTHAAIDCRGVVAQLLTTATLQVWTILRLTGKGGTSRRGLAGSDGSAACKAPPTR